MCRGVPTDAGDFVAHRDVPNEALHGMQAYGKLLERHGKSTFIWLGREKIIARVTLKGSEDVQADRGGRLGEDAAGRPALLKPMRGWTS